MGLPPDYWDFVPNDPQQEPSPSPMKKTLTHAQVYHILKDVDSSFLKGLLSRKNWIFLQNFPLTPNCHRLTEFGHGLTFDQRTRAYKKMIDFKGSANELSTCVLDCIKLSKIRPEKQSPTNAAFNKDTAPKMNGLKYMKEVHLGKRTDFCFRMVCVGDPYLKLDEIGVPLDIAETMIITEQLNSLNWDKINGSCGMRILEKGEIFVRRKGSLVPVRLGANLQTGDNVNRPLVDGDIVLINRPPSIHSHSLIALSVKILPVNSVLSINPLICSPLRGDFDGDSLHGYIPQSMDCRVELHELVSLKNQLVDKQSGQNLLSLSHDSLTAAHLLVEDGVLLDRFRIQQLQMFCSHKFELPAVIKAHFPRIDFKRGSSSRSCFWTGKQLFSLLLPPDFDYDIPGVQISKGELVASSNASFWLRDNYDSIFYKLLEHCQREEVLGFLNAAQGVLLEWLSMRGFSVSLSDLYLSSDSNSRKNMSDEVLCGLREAERIAHAKLLMVDSYENLLSGNLQENEHFEDFGSERMCYEQQKSAALSRASVSAFKQVFSDIQNLIYHYSRKDNSFLSMLKAGSKGNLMRFVQHSMCLGYQHSLVPLSFHFPHQLSCMAWNNQKAESRNLSSDIIRVEKFIPYGVIENSFLTGLNPLEFFVHSVTSRDGSFGGHADISGTLNRKLMFFMRDLYIGYDGTVRSPYGNQLVQFSYNLENTTASNNGRGKSLVDPVMGGEPVGALAACAISEAAYGALDQPISVLENSPLLNLKKILECGVRKTSGDKTASLFFSKKLKRWTNGLEYGALEVKNHLEKVLFQDIVSLVTIFYSPHTFSRSRSSPWICHFHISKEALIRKQLKLQSIVETLSMTCNSTIRKRSNVVLPKLQIKCKDCLEIEADMQKENDAKFCITVQEVESTIKSPAQLNVLQDLVIPFLLETVIKGSSNVKKVEILWKDEPSMSRCRKGSSGELYLRVFMSENCDRRAFWRNLMDNCIPIMGMIDWERSHPDDIQDITSTKGIDAAWNHFLSALKSAVLDTGRTILPEHLILAADCLSATGEFAPLSAKGLSQQRKQTSVSSPFMQACFSSPADCFVKAAKTEVVDNLQGIVDALSWGKVPSLGTGGQFEILYSGKGHQVAQSEDIYNLLGSPVNVHERKVLGKVHNDEQKDRSGKNGFNEEEHRKLVTVLKKHFTAETIQRLANDLKYILRKYAVNHVLNQDDKAIALKALCFHPHMAEKIGSGPYEIKVGHHPKYRNARCFMLVRTDGTEVDFSYHKCIYHALELIDPEKATPYQSKWLNGKELKE